MNRVEENISESKTSESKTSEEYVEIWFIEGKTNLSLCLTIHWQFFNKYNIPVSCEIDDHYSAIRINKTTYAKILNSDILKDILYKLDYYKDKTGNICYSFTNPL